MRITKIGSMLLLVAAFTATVGAQDHAMKDCPMKTGECPMKGGVDHDAAVDKRGDHAMGFSHETTTHHFLISPDGGSIEISANDAGDSAATTAIREHLSHMTKKFAAGDFDIPMFIHDKVPPGVDVMKRLRAEVRYRYEENERGARIAIRSDNPEAVRAIQKFLRFQITEHRTGDPLTLETH
jgi:hypothetical protein